MKTMKIMKILKKIENNENHRITCENHEDHEILIIPCKNLQFVLKIIRQNNFIAIAIVMITWRHRSQASKSQFNFITKFFKLF